MSTGPFGRSSSPCEGRKSNGSRKFPYCPFDGAPFRAKLPPSRGVWKTASASASSQSCHTSPYFMGKRMPDSGISPSDECGRASSKNIETPPSATARRARADGLTPPIALQTLHNSQYMSTAHNRMSSIPVIASCTRPIRSDARSRAPRRSPARRRGEEPTSFRQQLDRRPMPQGAGRRPDRDRTRRGQGWPPS